MGNRLSSFPVYYLPCRINRSLPAAISNMRTNILRSPIPGQNSFRTGSRWCWYRCYDDGTRISFCASATFVFTTPPVTLTRNERGMPGDVPSPSGRRGGEADFSGRDLRLSFIQRFQSSCRSEIPRGTTSLRFCASVLRETNLPGISRARRSKAKSRLAYSTRSKPCYLRSERTNKSSRVLVMLRQ